MKGQRMSEIHSVLWRRLHPLLYVARLAMGVLPRGRRPEHAPKLNLHSPIGQKPPEAEKAEVAEVLWRAAMVQMKAVNTATAWPVQGHRKMRREAEERL